MAAAVNHPTAFHPTVCVCMPEVCAVIDENGNKNGVAQVDDLPADNAKFLALLKGAGVSLKKYSECVSLTEDKARLIKKINPFKIMGAVLGGVTLGTLVVGGIAGLLGFMMAPAILALVVGGVLGGVLGAWWITS